MGYGIPDFSSAFDDISSYGDLESQNTATVYPNPFSDRIHISGLSPEINQVVVKIIDLNGQVAWKSDKAVSGGAFSIRSDLSELPGGFYLLKIETAGQSFIRKLIKL